MGVVQKPSNSEHIQHSACKSLQFCAPKIEKASLLDLVVPDLSPLTTGLCYRNSISATLSALPRTDDKASTVTSNSEKGGGGGGSGTEDCSIGSAGSLAKRNQHNTQGLPWDDEDVESGKSVQSIYNPLQAKHY
jgi:hypothetical protein